MDKDSVRNIIYISVGIGILAMIIFIFVLLFNQVNGSGTFSKSSVNSGYDFIYVGTTTLSPIGYGVITNNVYAYNDTYASCDGIDDFLLLYPPSNDTLAFYYNSSTSVNWQFVVNVLGTQYTNGTLGNAPEYPVYWNGTHYFFCKTDATTFWEGSIDKISIYDCQLNDTEIETLYQETRW